MHSLLRNDARPTAVGLIAKSEMKFLDVKKSLKICNIEKFDLTLQNISAIKIVVYGTLFEMRRKAFENIDRFK